MAVKCAVRREVRSHHVSPLRPGTKLKGVKSKLVLSASQIILHFSTLLVVVEDDYRSSNAKNKSYLELCNRTPFDPKLIYLHY
jgi:hypothetical protein